MNRNPLTVTPPKHQAGVTLIELLVGIAIGLLVIAVAMGSLMVSRGISGTVSEASTLQQQASYAFRVIGQQIRQAGSMELNLTPSILSTPGADYAMSPVAFDPPDPTEARPPFSRASSTLNGVATPLSFTIGYQNYTETISAPSGNVTASLLRDCLGQNPAMAASGTVAATPVLTSRFERNASNELVCEGAGGGGAQAVVGNVTDMRVKYIGQAPGTTNLQYHPSTYAGPWSNIYAIEVCLELTGTETTPTNGQTYKNCSDIDTPYGDRLKMVFRNVFQIRSQGLS